MLKHPSNTWIREVVRDSHRGARQHPEHEIRLREVGQEPGHSDKTFIAKEVREGALAYHQLARSEGGVLVSLFLNNYLKVSTIYE